jgi:hypothetical protein
LPKPSQPGFPISSPFYYDQSDAGSSKRLWTLTDKPGLCGKKRCLWPHPNSVCGQLRLPSRPLRLFVGQADWPIVQRCLAYNVILSRGWGNHSTIIPNTRNGNQAASGPQSLFMITMFKAWLLRHRNPRTLLILALLPQASRSRTTKSSAASQPGSL